ncbi:CDP-alcohol phosphatidyltransferase family protein [Cuneatibacter caecimuris]|uniref:CDP-diacylglycerol--serine O-phosphatidyltransferase n=1 Tax=Cuneatibacter caecimuris TaxID=1796618 RepID=A0A4Q7PQI4_9FIRM|nr:CDP-alcohol phosphatidyltransferase family protein [Cuneatibacter caecimuris]RZT02586.1 CDP-diacylglycerol--serine O-phosphatidyltransferase [Cuneatibacter caecimuris]
MIGFYNHSVILTYIGLASAVIGMTQALGGHPKIALACLIIAGGCDMFDGKIARAMKNRTEDEKRFGIQIDSLCDLICFGAFPAIMGYAFGLRGIVGTGVMVLFVLAAVIRLGYFNVVEERRQQETDEVRKYYQGLPVTSIAILFPAAYLLRGYFPDAFVYILEGVLLLVAVLFVADIKVPKPGNKVMVLFFVLAAAILLKLFVF